MSDAELDGTPSESGVATPSDPDRPDTERSDTARPDTAQPGPGRRAAERGARVAPKRRGRAKRRHTIGRVLLATVVVLALASGLGVVFLYRHLNGNIDVLDVSDQVTNRPTPIDAGPQDPLNVLVMGSDTRAGAGNNIDGLTGDGERSDTTLLLHLSADRERAYGISIPRDLLVTRPDCIGEDGQTIPGGTSRMWNEAFSLGGPACTIQQFEQLTDIRVDHFVVVDFQGFRGMVDAIGGVEMCIPEDIDDPAHNIHIAAGTRKLRGEEALNYVRERYVIGDGSDLGRMKRQQAFVASMAHQVVTAGTLARPDRLIRFLDAATKSLTVDPELKSVAKLAGLGSQVQGIGLDHIQFTTIPVMYSPEDPNRLIWRQPDASQMWTKIRKDEPLSKRLSGEVISAGKLPGSSNSSPKPSDDESSGESPSGDPNAEPSQTPSPEDEEARQALENAGLCA